VCVCVYVFVYVSFVYPILLYMTNRGLSVIYNIQVTFRSLCSATTVITCIRIIAHKLHFLRIRIRSETFHLTTVKVKLYIRYGSQEGERKRERERERERGGTHKGSKKATYTAHVYRSTWSRVQPQTFSIRRRWLTRSSMDISSAKTRPL
jgi:hypothetical protein